MADASDEKGSPPDPSKYTSISTSADGDDGGGSVSMKPPPSSLPPPPSRKKKKSGSRMEPPTSSPPPLAERKMSEEPEEEGRSMRRVRDSDDTGGGGVFPDGLEDLSVFDGISEGGGGRPSMDGRSMVPRASARSSHPIVQTASDVSLSASGALLDYGGGGGRAQEQQHDHERRTTRRVVMKRRQGGHEEETGLEHTQSVRTRPVDPAKSVVNGLSASAIVPGGQMTMEQQMAYLQRQTSWQQLQMQQMMGGGVPMSVSATPRQVGRNVAAEEMKLAVKAQGTSIDQKNAEDMAALTYPLLGESLALVDGQAERMMAETMPKAWLSYKNKRTVVKPVDGELSSSLCYRQADAISKNIKLLEEFYKLNFKTNAEKDARGCSVQ